MVVSPAPSSWQLLYCPGIWCPAVAVDRPPKGFKEPPETDGFATLGMVVLESRTWSPKVGASRNQLPPSKRCHRCPHQLLHLASDTLRSWQALTETKAQKNKLQRSKHTKNLSFSGQKKSNEAFSYKKVQPPWLTQKLSAGRHTSQRAEAQSPGSKWWETAGTWTQVIPGFLCLEDGSSLVFLGWSTCSSPSKYFWR